MSYSHYSKEPNKLCSKSTCPNYPNQIHYFFLKNRRKVLWLIWYSLNLWIINKIWNGGSCTNLSETTDLLQPSRASQFGRIFHDEKSGGGSDYTVISLEDSRYGSYNIAGADINNAGNVKFDVWPYPSDFAYFYQNQLLYFIK